MKIERTVFVDYNGCEFEHGKVSFEKNDCEVKVEINCHLAIVGEEQDKLFEEIKELIQKYAI